MKGGVYRIHANGDYELLEDSLEVIHSAYCQTTYDQDTRESFPEIKPEREAFYGGALPSIVIIS